ncbi:MAG: SPOR domain-containing protein [Bacteroidota bacterium]
MPNLNVKGDAPKSSGSSSGGSGGGIPKTALIIVGAVVALGAIAFILNTTGIVKLWGKKKPAPQVVSIPTDSYQPVTQDTTSNFAEAAVAPDTTVPSPEENLTKVETTAQPRSKSKARKDIVHGTGMFTVQISSWPVVEKANAQAQVFTEAGFDAFIEPMGNYYRVCVGRFETKADAKAQMEKMEHMLESRPVVVKVGK